MAEEPQMQAKSRETNGRFPKGVSGNPGGRPKNHYTSIINLLEKTIEEVMVGGKRTYKEAIVTNWLVNILNNKDKQGLLYLKEALDRLYGQAEASVKHSGDPDKPITLLVKYDDGNKK